MESFTGSCEALPAASVPFGDEDDVLVAPSGNGSALHPGCLGDLPVCGSGDEGVDGDRLSVGDLRWSDSVGSFIS